MLYWRRRFLALLIDIVVVNGAYLIGLMLTFRGEIPPEELQYYFDIAVILNLLHFAAFYFLKVYDRNFMIAGWDDFLAVFKGAALGSLLVVVATFYNRTLGFSRLGFAYAFIGTLLFTLLWRFLLRAACEMGWRRHLRLRRVVLIGDGVRTEQVAHKLEKDYRYGYEVLGSLGITTEGSLGNYRELCEVFNRLRFDEVVIAAVGAPIKELLTIFETIVSLQLPCRVLPGLYELLMARAPVTHLGDIPMLELSFRPARTSTEIVKRIVDLVFAALFSLLTLPLIVVLGILIKLESPGPVFFNRQRVGLRGKELIMYKLRTMRWEPDRPLDLTMNADDPRITRIGKILRRWSLDELPQLWNVLKGEMSLVGPRPEIPSVVVDYDNWQRSVLTIKPGITGLAQVSGRDELVISEKLHLDIYYSRNYSMALDLKILAKTIWVVLNGQGVK